MRTRIPYEWLIVVGVLCASTARAQDGYSVIGPGAEGVVPAGHSAPAYFQPSEYYSPGLYSELLPQDRGWFYDHDSRLDLTLREMFRGSWLRLEYLNTQVHRDSKQDVLGSETNLTDNAGVPFEILANDGVTVLIAQGFSTRGLRWKDMQGIRGSAGLKLTDELFLEGSAWGSQKQQVGIASPVLFPVGTVGFAGALLTNVAVIPSLTNGNVGTGAVVFDDPGNQPFGHYNSQIFAADINFVSDLIDRNDGWVLKGLLGYRHEQYCEQLTFAGTRNNSTGIFPGGILVPPIITFYDSRTQNYRDEFQFGLRSEWEAWRLTFGVEPKVGLGTNLAKSVYDETGIATTRDRSVQFAQSFDMDVYLKMKITEWMNLRIGYDLLWLGRVGVADSSVRNNDVGGVDDDRSSLVYENRTIQSFTFGGEIVLP